MKKPAIEFKDFSFQYRAQAKPTLNNINLTIYKGEKVLIVGPSGSGKSTLSNCINGLVPFSYKGEIKGSLKINGKETKELSIAKISNMVGTVLQDPDSQFIGLTVAEDIAFKLENDCVEQEEMKRRVQMVSKIVEIDTHLNSAPHRLSGGQKQRVTLAGAMVGEAEILLFDEPLASLDPATGKSAIELIDKIQKENKKEILERESEKEKRKRTLKTKCTRGIIYFIGLIVLALGIVLNTKTLLGVSPIISIPYNICHIWHLNLGAITFVFYCFCVLIESILKGKEFKLYELLQIPMSLVTSVFINIFDQYLNIVPDTLGQKLLVLFFAIVVTGIGAATMVNMKLVPNPADALAATIGDKLGKGMGIGKNVFDVTCFCTSGIIGLVFTRHIIGLGIGTVLAVIFTGRVIAVYNYFLKHPMQNLAGITAEL